MTETKELLVEIQDIGRRLAGINVEISVNTALDEVEDAIDALTKIQGELLGISDRQGDVDDD